MDVCIREASLQDCETLAYLAAQLGYPAQAEQMRRRLASLAPELCAVFVALGEGRVLGFAHVGRKASILVERCAELRGLIVDQEHRGRGIGRALLQAAESWAMQHGCQQMDVSTNVLRAGARVFYDRMGYEAYKESIRFRKDLPQIG